MKKLTAIFIILIITTTTIAFACMSGEEEQVALYKVGDNDTIVTVDPAEVIPWTATYEWSIEPTTLMYTEDGRSSYIWNSEVEQYKKVGWSLQPPVTIYGANGATRSVLVEHKQDYLDTGVWFNTYEEANKPIFTYNVYQKSNLSVEQINRMLANTGLAGYGETIKKAEDEFGINAMVTIGIACHESGNGTSSAFRNKNNAFGLGPGMRFKSVDDGIMYFAELMNRKCYYGKSLEQINKVYCPNDGGHWAVRVKAHMREKWERGEIV